MMRAGVNQSGKGPPGANDTGKPEKMESVNAMSTEVLDNLIKQAEMLSPDEQLRLAAIWWSAPGRPLPLHAGSGARCAGWLGPLCLMKRLKRILRARGVKPMSTASQLKNGFPKSPSRARR